MTTPVDLQQVRKLPCHLETEVTEEFIDYNGHMNVLEYLRLGALALEKRLESVGVTEEYRRERRTSTFAVEHHLTYQSEIHLGATVRAYPQLLARRGKVGHMFVYLIDETRDRLAGTVEAVFVHTHMDERRAVSFPDDITSVLDPEIERDVAIVSAPVCGSMGPRP